MEDIKAKFQISHGTINKNGLWRQPRKRMANFKFGK